MGPGAPWQAAAPVLARVLVLIAAVAFASAGKAEPAADARAKGQARRPEDPLSRGPLEAPRWMVVATGASVAALSAAALARSLRRRRRP